MAYNYLITITDFAEVRDVSSNVDFDKRIKPYIKEAQEFDIKPILGETMFYDLLANYTDTNYAELLAGKSYTYNSKTYQFIGLKTIIVYYAYARFIANDGIKSTPTGFVTKSNNFSDPISESAVNRNINQTRSAANAYNEDMKLFLDRNSSDYDEWSETCKKANKKKVNFSTVTK